MTMMRMKLIGFYHIVLISMGNAHVIRKGRETGQTSGATKCVNYCTNGTGDSSPLTNMVDVLRSAHAVHNLVVAVKIGLVLRLPYGTMCCSLRPLPRNPIIMYSLLLDEPHLSTTHVKGSDSLLLGVKVNMKWGGGGRPPPLPKKIGRPSQHNSHNGYRSLSARSRSAQTEKWQKAGRGCTVEIRRCRLLGWRTTSSRQGHLGAAMIAPDDDLEMMDFQQIHVGPLDRWSLHMAELFGICYTLGSIYTQPVHQGSSNK